MGLYQLPGSNALGVRNGVLELMNEAAQDFPDDLEWDLVYDATEYIEASIAEVEVGGPLSSRRPTGCRPLR